jgi:hypothetical protein
MANGSFVDNFASYEYADLNRVWTVFGSIGACDIQPKYGRLPGGGALYYAAGGGVSGVFRNMPQGAAATVVMHFAILFPSIPTSTNAFLWLTDGGTPGTTGNQQCYLGITSAGKLVFYRAAGSPVLLATSTNALSPNVWYTIEAKVTINNTTGAYEIRVDGTSTGWIPAATGANTRGSTLANNSADGYAFGGTASAVIFQLTDVLVANTSQSTITDFVGPGRIALCYPSGAGSHTDWTPNFGSNYACVSEKQGDGDVSFNQSSTPNQIDSFQMEDVSAGATIKCVQINTLARKDAGSARTIATLVRSGGGTDHLGTTFSLSSSYTVLCDMMEVDPDTGSAWTAANWNAEEVGYKEIS